ncbi:hypothetical protein [Histophilus somni]|uniref:hypothetical protein n=1 Tax=Histophilus somni TaxID=731 RepID=UPI00201F2B18|nr:hypothetical protein [Histophilus somni]
MNGQFPNEWFELVPLGLGEANSRAELFLFAENRVEAAIAPVNSNKGIVKTGE